MIFKTTSQNLGLSDRRAARAADGGRDSLPTGIVAVDAAAADGEEPHTDCVLLRRFLLHQDQDAFRTLVERHGPLVYGVAWRILHDCQAAEDVFQATFLVLVRKGKQIRRRTSLASWLHGVARRIALRLLQRRFRQREVPMVREPIREHSPLDIVGRRWEMQILDEELQQIPLQYREALILHELEGLNCEETAARLRVTVAALEGRLKRGRKELKFRLLRRGLGVGAVLAALQTGQVTAACWPRMELIRATIEAAMRPDSVSLAPRSSQTPASQLARQEFLAMLSSKVSVDALVLGALLLIGGLIVGRLSTWGELGGAPGVPLLLPQLAGMTEESSAGPVQQPEEVRHLEWTVDTSAQSPAPLTALDVRVSLDFDNIPLQQALRELSQRYSVNLVIAPQALEQAGVSPDLPISMHLDGISVRTALKLLLQSHALLAEPQGEVILIRYDAWNDPRWATGDYRQMTPNEQRIHDALEQRFDVEFIDAKLGDALNILSNRYQIPILPDVNNLETVDVSLDQQISLVISGITLESGLNLLL